MWVMFWFLWPLTSPLPFDDALFMNVPRELDESAMIDGCNRFRFLHVIMLSCGLASLPLG